MVNKKTNLKDLSFDEKENLVRGVMDNAPDLSIIDVDKLKRFVSDLPIDTDKRMECFEALAFVFSEAMNGPTHLIESEIVKLSPDLKDRVRKHTGLTNSLFTVGADSAAGLNALNKCKYTDENGNVDLDLSVIPDEVKSRMFMLCGDNEIRPLFPDNTSANLGGGLLGSLCNISGNVELNPDMAPLEYKEAYYKYHSLIDEARAIDKQITDKAIADGFLEEA